MAASVAASYDHTSYHPTVSEDQRDHHLLPLNLQPNHNLHLQFTTKTAKHSNFNTNPSTARKKLTKGNEGKDKTRRGMGVEQLERLRLGEMTEINPNSVPPSSSEVPLAAIPAVGVPPSSSSSGVPFAVIPAASFVHDSTILHTTVPSHLVAKYGASGCSAGNASTGVVGLHSNHQHAVTLWIPGVGLFHGQGQLVPDVNFQRNFYGVPNGSEASRELSSTPNKKRNYEGQSLMYKRTNDPIPGIPTSVSVGYNVGNNLNKKETTSQAFGENAGHNAGGTYLACHTDKGNVDAENVQKKLGGSSRVGRTGKCLMEYEFFPAYGKDSEIGSDEKDLVIIKKLALGDGSLMMAGGAGGGYTSCVTTRTTSCGGAGFVDAPSPIDLSLKLSY